MHIGADFREAGILGEETIAWMNRVRAGDQRGTDDIGNVKVALSACPWADADMLIRHAYREGIAISF